MAHLNNQWVDGIVAPSVTAIGIPFLMLLQSPHLTVHIAGITSVTPTAQSSDTSFAGDTCRHIEVILSTVDDGGNGEEDGKKSTP